MKVGLNKEKAALRRQKHELEVREKQMVDFYQKELMRGVKNANYVCFSIMVLCLKNEGWGNKRLLRLLEGYFAMADELADGRAKPNDVIEMAETSSGLEIRGTLDSIAEKVMG